MKISDIAQRQKVSVVFVYKLIEGERHTTNYRLALDVSKLTQKPAISFISPRLRQIYIRAYPKLKEGLTDV